MAISRTLPISSQLRALPRNTHSRARRHAAACALQHTHAFSKLITLLLCLWRRREGLFTIHTHTYTPQTRTHRHADTHTHTHTQTHTHRQRDSHTHTETDIHAHTDAHSHRHTHTHTH